MPCEDHLGQEQRSQSNFSPPQPTTNDVSHSAGQYCTWAATWMGQARFSKLSVPALDSAVAAYKLGLRCGPVHIAANMVTQTDHIQSE